MSGMAHGATVRVWPVLMVMKVERSCDLHAHNAG